MYQNFVAATQGKICRKENQNLVSYIGYQILRKGNFLIDICCEVWDNEQVFHVRQEEPEVSLKFPSFTGSFQSVIGPSEEQKLGRQQQAELECDVTDSDRRPLHLATENNYWIIYFSKSHYSRPQLRPLKL
jgi:hypothetical protein